MSIPAVADVCQIFKDEGIGFAHNLFADVVVLPRHEPLLAASTLRKAASCCSCACGLECPTSVTIVHDVRPWSAEYVAITRDGGIIKGRGD
jgi:hypothetical protein